MRFGILALPDVPFPALSQRWRAIEQLGFDQLWMPDHSGDYRDRAGHWFDGWTALAAAAGATSSIRIGSLVSNPILRSPVLLANEAVAVDHLSGGRLEVGIGTGVAEFDHRAMGIAVRSPRERAAQLAEYVEVVDGMLRSPSETFRFEGEHYRTYEPAMVPAPLQRPRPPIVIGGQAPRVLRIAARFADAWNTHGPFGRSPEEILDVTRRQNSELDELCAAAGRDPAALRRALLLYGPLDAWSAPGSVEATITRFADAGMQEFVFLWPPDNRLAELERLAADVVPALRGG